MTAILRWSPCVTMVIRRDAVRLCYEDTKIPGHIRHPKRKKKAVQPSGESPVLLPLDEYLMSFCYAIIGGSWGAVTMH